MLTSRTGTAALVLLIGLSLAVSPLAATEISSAKKTSWHGYDQSRFTVEGRACYLVVPKQPAHGRPWVWRARFPDYHPEIDIALLGKGFHIAYLDVAAMFGSPAAVAYGNHFYKQLTDQYHLSKKPVLEGVSRGGLFIYNWAAANPDKVACIYADKPVMDFKSWPGGKGNGLGSPRDWQKCLKAYGLTEQQALAYHHNPIDHVPALVKARIPILHIVSRSDHVVPPGENTDLARMRVPEKLRRLFRVMSVRKGTVKSHGHHFKHPNPSRVVSFIVQQTVYEGGYVSTGVSRTLKQIEELYASIPPLDYKPPKSRWKCLPRTMQRLRSGPELRIVMLGDSIVNDTARSQWHLLLDRSYPKCQITRFTSVRGSTGCWWYRNNDRVKLYVLDQKPDLVIIGGISQRGDIAAIREVIGQIRAGSQAEVLLLSGAFGRVDPLNDKQWQYDIDPAGKDYRARLQRLAQELKVEFLDMRAPWGRYIRKSGKKLEWFKRDPVHANPRGEQVEGRILYRYLAP